MVRKVFYFYLVIWINLVFLICIISPVVGQDKKGYFNKALSLFEEKKYTEAISLFKKSIQARFFQNPSYYYLAYSLNAINKFEYAMPYIDSAIKYNSKDLKFFLLRAEVYKNLTQYEKAMEDLDFLLSTHPRNTGALHCKGIIYAMFNNYDSACVCFDYTKDVIKQDKKFFEKNCIEEMLELPEDSNNILYITEMSDDASYGFSEKKPVEVGTGAFGGVVNEKMYLSFLRDAEGEPVTYERIGQCCPFSYYSTKGYLSKYEIAYTDDTGKRQIRTVYLTSYKYSTPKILKGLSTFKTE